MRTFLVSCLALVMLSPRFAIASEPIAKHFKIHAPDGGRFGSWGEPMYCKPGTFATGLSLRIEPGRGGDHDDTAVNRIQIHCSTPKGNRAQVLESSGREWGDWSSVVRCPKGTVIYAYRLGMENYLGGGKDDTMANSLEVRCRKPYTYAAPVDVALSIRGPFHNYWTPWTRCPVNSNIYGFATKDENRQYDSDDTALNDVKFFCRR